MLGSRWAQKPPVGTAIDWGAPHARGLMGFYALNEGTGPSVRDACRNIDLTCTGYGSTNPWAAGPSGTGLWSGPSGSMGAMAIIPPRLQLGWPITIACGVRILGTVSNSGRIFALMPFQSVAPPYVDIAIYMASNTQVGFAFASGGTGIFPTTYATITQGLDYVFGLTVTPTSYAFYANGALVASGTGTYGAPSYTATATLLAAGWTVASNTACNPLYWGGWWSRVLDPGEHAGIGRDVNAIWRIFSRQEWARTGLAARLSYPRAASVLRPVQLPTTDLTCYLD